MAIENIGNPDEIKIQHLESRAEKKSKALFNPETDIPNEIWENVKASMESSMKQYSYSTVPEKMRFLTLPFSPVKIEIEPISEGRFDSFMRDALKEFDRSDFDDQVWVQKLFFHKLENLKIEFPKKTLDFLEENENIFEKLKEKLNVAKERLDWKTYFDLASAGAYLYPKRSNELGFDSAKAFETLKELKQDITEIPQENTLATLEAIKRIAWVRMISPAQKPELSKAEIAKVLEAIKSQRTQFHYIAEGYFYLAVATADHFAITQDGFEFNFKGTEDFDSLKPMPVERNY